MTFSDPPSQSQYTKADVDRVLRESEEQASLLKSLEMEMARSREYLSKVRFLSFNHLWFPLLPSIANYLYAAQAIRSKEESAWTAMDEELIFATDRAGMGMGGGAFTEDAMFS